MKENSLPIIWTNDDIHAGKASELERQLTFLDRFSIPGVFFVIPRSGGHDLDEDRDLVKMMLAAQEKGHEFYQHGFQHFDFECGVPCLRMFELDPKAKKRYDVERDAIEELHTLEAQVAMLENGQRIWRRVFGENSAGFRPGWGSYCNNFYKALALLGYQWVSSRIPSMTAYCGEYDKALEFYDIPLHPYRLKQGIWEFPIANDFAWRVPNDPEQISGMVRLGMESFEVYCEKKAPLLLVSHFHGLKHSGEVPGKCPPHPTGTGYEVHEQLLTKYQETGSASFIGMKELTTQMQTASRLTHL